MSGGSQSSKSSKSSSKSDDPLRLSDALTHVTLSIPPPNFVFQSPCKHCDTCPFFPPQSNAAVATPAAVDNKSTAPMSDGKSSIPAAAAAAGVSSVCGNGTDAAVPISIHLWCRPSLSMQFDRFLDPPPSYLLEDAATPAPPAAAPKPTAAPKLTYPVSDIPDGFGVLSSSNDYTGQRVWNGGLCLSAFCYALEHTRASEWRTVGKAMDPFFPVLKPPPNDRDDTLSGTDTSIFANAMTETILASASPPAASAAPFVSACPHSTIRGRRVLELGAGTGLGGLMATACGAAVVTITDGSADAITLITNNCIANQRMLPPAASNSAAAASSVTSVVRTAVLRWGDESHIEAVRKLSLLPTASTTTATAAAAAAATDSKEVDGGGGYDVIIGSDLIYTYEDGIIQSLIGTVAALLARSVDSHFYLLHVPRGIARNVFMTLLRRWCSPAGLCCALIAVDPVMRFVAPVCHKTWADFALIDVRWMPERINA